MSAMTEATVEQLIAGMRAALDAQDMPAVAAFIRMIAVKEPRTAEIILDCIDLAASKHSPSDANRL